MVNIQAERKREREDTLTPVWMHHTRTDMETGHTHSHIHSVGFQAVTLKCFDRKLLFNYRLVLSIPLYSKVVCIFEFSKYIVYCLLNSQAVTYYNELLTTLLVYGSDLWSLWEPVALTMIVKPEIIYIGETYLSKCNFLHLYEYKVYSLV